MHSYTTERGCDAGRDPEQLIQVPNLYLNLRHPGANLNKFNSSWWTYEIPRTYKKHWYHRLRSEFHAVSLGCLQLDKPSVQ